jgi:hypothetical protein
MAAEDAREAEGRDPNQAAAHYFLSELRTRISTQPLPYQHGNESRALESLWEVFDQARKAMEKYPGCNEFADAATAMLNLKLRPVTAKWHRAMVEGRLNSRDGADEFRGDLEKAQNDLRLFAGRLHKMAYGVEAEDEIAPDLIGKDDLDRYFSTVESGIATIPLVASQPKQIRDQIEELNRQFDGINTAERAALKARREQYGLAGTSDAIGLALSGGGIRSATFCLGVVQVLAKRGLFKDIDFLSTVSGGGYAGCFITTRLGGNETQETIAGPDGPDPIAVRYLRQHAKYLAALDIKQAWGMVTSTLAGMLLNWSAPLFLVTLAAALVSTYSLLGFPQIPWRIPVAIMAVISVIALVLYGRALPNGRDKAADAGARLAWALAITVLFVVLGLLQLGYGYVTAPKHWVSSGIAAAVITAAPAIIRYIPVLKNPTIRKIALQILLVLAAIVVPLAGIVLFYFLIKMGIQSARWTVLLFAASAFFAFIAFRLLNINLTGPHRLYRDQLARTFVQTDEADATPVPLSSINQGARAPYHLINTTLNVPSSGNVALRERKSDFFLFSKSYCGSPATGYFPTTDWKANDAVPDLATAMAISGAAASSYMGLGSMPTLTALLTFLNVRLGFWIRNQKRPDAKGYPAFACLMREMFGLKMSEREPWLNLSDGGHIENLAIYELLRRRCKLIISVDGESDPAYTFQGLMTLVRHAQIDFGARIEVNLSDIRPDPTTGYSQSHAALCTVHYPDGSLGFIIYMKLSVTGNESEMIRRYRINHPEFPHQSTLDQFFDEEQFEVYRQLGVHVANGLFLPALMDWDDKIDDVPKWFRKLVKNLLPKPIGTT